MKDFLKNNLMSFYESDTDPDGSYTGNPVDGGRPVQDADDL